MRNARAGARRQAREMADMTVNRKSFMKVLKRLILVLLLIAGLFPGWIAYSISPYPAENQFPPAQELVSVYREIYLKQFSCV